MFSKACEYGIKATIYIAMQSLQDRRVSLKEIAEKVDSPSAFTAKILHQLAKNDILDSTKGPAGGFQIQKERIDNIKLAHIVFAIDGESIYEGCGLGLDKCNANKPCQGPAGGFQIQKERIDNIKLAHIVFAIDGESIYEGCGLGLDKCNANKPCPVP